MILNSYYKFSFYREWIFTELSLVEYNYKILKYKRDYHALFIRDKCVLFSYQIIWKRTGRAKVKLWQTHPSLQSGPSSPSIARRKWHWISECTHPTNMAQSLWRYTVLSGCWIKLAWCYPTEYVPGAHIYDFWQFYGQIAI